MTDYEKKVNMHIRSGEALVKKSRKKIKRLCIELQHEQRNMSFIYEALCHWMNEKKKTYEVK